MTDEGTGMDRADEDGINLWQLLGFVVRNTKPLLVGSFVGAALGLGGWFVLAPYHAEQIINVEKVAGTDQHGGTEASIDYLAWRGLAQKLPILARQVLESGTIVDERDRLAFEPLANQKWWQHNVRPVYALTRADTKQVVGLSKELQDAESTTILNLVVEDRQGSPEAVQRRLEMAVDFIQRGGAYVSIASLATRYRFKLQSEREFVQQRMSATESELKYLKARAVRLEALRSRFPESAVAGARQVFVVDDNNAKFMPLASQLVALYVDIAKAEESLARARAQLEKHRLLSRFLEEGGAAVETELDGLKLAERLLNAEARLRKVMPDAESLQLLDTVRADLVSIRTRYAAGLQKRPSTRPRRASPVLPVLGGLAGAGFLTLISLALRDGWRRHRLDEASSTRHS